MKWTSTIGYTFEDHNGEEETFVNLSNVANIVITDKLVDLRLGDDDEGDILTVPIIKGYKTPYISDVTDDMGTEHYVYYEEEVHTVDLTDEQLHVLKELLSNDIDDNGELIRNYTVGELGMSIKKFNYIAANLRKKLLDL